jgi:hypothetical protein
MAASLFIPGKAVALFKELLVAFIHIQNGRIQGLAIGLSKPGVTLLGIYQVIGADGPSGFPKPPAHIDTGIILQPAAAKGFIDQFLLPATGINPVFVSPGA